MKVVMVEPNKPAYITEIGDDYKSIHDAVGGLIGMFFTAPLASLFTF